MTITKALERIFWRFQNIKGNETDQEALNTLAEFVNDKHNKQLQDNEMFAKCYVFMYAYFLKHYDTNIYDDIPQKELHRYLDQPMERIIERFKDRLNEKELEDYYKENNIEVTHPKIKRLDIDYKDSWEYETVKEQMEVLINLALNEFKTINK